MLIDDLQGLARIVLASLMVYPAIIVILRIAGKRALTKLSAFDFVVTVALGSLLATVIVSGDVALAEGVLAFAMLALLQWLVARLSLASTRFRDVTRSQPRLLVLDGAERAGAMRAERVTRADIEAAARQAGLGSLSQAGAIVLETDGSLSVLTGASADMDLISGLKRD